MLNPDWNPALYNQKHSFVFQHGADLLSLLEPRPGEAILDVGCGTGQLTQSIAELGAEVVGLDFSPAMIETARAAYPEIDFVVADAANFTFSRSFDAVFSNAALHWVTDAENAVICMARALKPGGRFVAEFGGRGNVARVIAGVREALREWANIEVEHDWYFPSIAEYSSLLEKHGLATHMAHLFDRPTPLEDGEEGLKNWFHMFGSGLFRGVPPQRQQEAMQKTEDQLRDVLFRDGRWFADYRRLRVVAHKP